MALLTHKTSMCADAFSSALFMDKGIYGVPYRDSPSRSPILSESASFDKLPPLKDDRAAPTPRKTPTVSPIRPEVSECSRERSTTELPSITVSRTLLEAARHDDASSLSSYEDDELFVSAGTSIRADSGAYSTTDSKTGSSISKRVCTEEKQPYVFKKWMKTMLRKPPATQNRLCLPDPFIPTLRTGSLVPSATTASLDDSRTKASSEKFVSGVQAASITMASCLWSAGVSEQADSMMGGLDEATLERMMDRKHVLEELITTEEYYIRDLKSLRDQYLPILRECVWVSADVRHTMARNVSEMLDIHTRLLDSISRALPCTTQMMTRAAEVDMDYCPILADPAAAAEVAKVFDTNVMAFFVYEEYSAKYEEVIQAPKRTQIGMQHYGKGIEALTGAANSWDNRGEYGKRAMELYDMLFKPIQRLCKYPLLFRDIAKHTPAMDCPNANRLLEKVQQRLDDQVNQVNVANSDPARTRARVQRTWLLQDRLTFDGKTDKPARLLGHVILCGTLHVTWQNKSDQVLHEYMVCILFKSYLILASVTRYDQYKVKFAIPLALAHVEGVDHGKGLYCPNAPHTSKVVFEADHRIYEVLLSACSDAEHNAWFSLVQERIDAETQDYREYSSTNAGFCVTIPSDTRSVGEVVGRPGTLARHQSLHRNASASALECNGRYLIINNLLSSTDPHGSEQPIHRSYSAPTVNDYAGVPIINLKRSERNQVEAKLEDVWTKELLPFNATRTMKEPNTIKRISMMSLIPNKKALSSASNASVTDCSDYGVFDDDGRQSGKSSRGPSMKSFRSKSSKSKSSPPSPTKRSSSLRSRLSLTSSMKNNQAGTSDALSTDLSSKRRNMRPLSDINKFMASGGPEFTLLDTICMSPTSMATERIPRNENASAGKLTNPPTPSTIDRGARDRSSVPKSKHSQAGERRTLSLQSSHKAATTNIEAIGLNRRHTVVIHPSTTRSWRTVKRKKLKCVPQEIPRERKPSTDLVRVSLPSNKLGRV